MPYTCEKVGCNFTVAIPICPSCNAFLTEDVHLAEAHMEPDAVELPKTIEWATAFGHWGDVFCCLGVIKSLLVRTGQAKTNVLYVGPYLDIVDWLEAQDCVGEVIGIKSTENDFYRGFWGATTDPKTVPEIWMGMLYQQMRGLPKAEQFTQTHVNAQWFQTHKGLPAQLWHGGALPNKIRQSAGMLMQDEIPRRPAQMYHLHPVSTMSEAAQNHWPHWLAAIEWLIEHTPHTYVLTGLHNIMFLPKSPRLVNLIGKTKSNMEVMAISACCDGVISTPNSIAIWSVIERQRCLCVGNLATQYLSSYYRRFLQRGDELTYCNVDTTFSGFQKAACDFLTMGEA